MTDDSSVSNFTLTDGKVLGFSVQRSVLRPWPLDAFPLTGRLLTCAMFPDEKWRPHHLLPGMTYRYASMAARGAVTGCVPETAM